MSRTLRSRTGIGAGAMIALCLAALSASAQERPVTSRQDRGDTVKINMSGAIVMDMVYRGPELSWLTNAVGDPAQPFGGGVGAQLSDGETTAEGFVSLRFDAELSDKISAVVELRHKRVQDEDINRFTGNTPTDINVRTAALKIQDFFQGGLNAQMGMVDWSFDVRGKGSSFAFDPRNSQTITRNLRNTEDTIAAWSTRGDDPQEMEPIGVVLSYAKDAWTLELVMLPVVAEGGNPTRDEALYAFDFWYNLESAVGKGSRIGFITALSAHSGNAIANERETAMITVGAGVNLVFQGGIELYGEIYKQAGKTGRDAADDDIKAAGYAFQVGLDYHLQGNENNIWLGINVTVVSGDEEDTVTDNDADAFMSYENVNDLLILESQYFGIDVDTNYTAVKIKGGITFGKLDITAIVGIVSASEELSDGAGDHEDKFGNEFDVNARYNLNKQVALTANFGLLLSSDILEVAMGSSGEADDRCAVGSVGFDVRW